MKTSPEREAQHWREHLSGLPDVDPPAALWQRVQQARAAQATPQRKPHRGAPRIAIAASVLVAVAAGAVWQSQPVPVSTPGLHGSAGVLAVMDAGVRQLDDEIALAYARDADEAELSALWQARDRLLGEADASAPALIARL